MHLETVAGLNVALPAMAREFNTGIDTAIWIQVAYGAGDDTCLDRGVRRRHVPGAVFILSGLQNNGEIAWQRLLMTAG